ncbi:MAG: YqiA/YcfP family alpha/beta fold hydrolase, partial [Betaproteobacteria bacterium]
MPAEPVVIVYLHGFNSSPSSHKARTMARYLEERGLGDRFVCPALPHRPEEAMDLVEGLIAGFGNREFTIVGSSLGGFYATWLAEKHACRAILKGFNRMAGKTGRYTTRFGVNFDPELERTDYDLH